MHTNIADSMHTTPNSIQPGFNCCLLNIKLFMYVYIMYSYKILHTTATEYILLQVCHTSRQIQTYMMRGTEKIEEGQC